MQFKVPQFLEIEDKIFGPFTFREFVYLVGGGGLCFVLFKLMGFLFAFIPMLIVAAISLSLIYYKPNNKPFLNMIEAGIKFYSQDKLFIWKRREEQAKDRVNRKNTSLETLSRPTETIKLNGSKLRDLAWSLDVLDLKKQHDNTTI